MKLYLLTLFSYETLQLHYTVTVELFLLISRLLYFLFSLLLERLEVLLFGLQLLQL